MECNREEAMLAKAMAEKKLGEKDVMGAKKLALKALRCYPELDGLPQFLATLEVYISSEEKINGEINWYKVLGISPSADYETIRKHYRKLALALHPDKNKSVGAEGAFKLICEAWGCLSDNVRRSAFDQMRNSNRVVDNVRASGSSFGAGKNGFHDFFKDEKLKNSSKNYTFWTLCAHCKTQFEYQRCYVNTNLLCHHCRKPFFAVEMPLGPMNGNGSKSDVRKEPVSRPLVTGEELLAAFRKAVSAGKEAKERKVHGFKEAGSGSVGDKLKKKRCIDELNRSNPPPQIPTTNGGVGNSGAQMGNSVEINQLRELSQLELRNMLMVKAKKSILSNLGSSIPEKKEKRKRKVSNVSEVADTKPGFHSESSVAKLDDEIAKKGVDMAVPDPDFHDFDSGRTEGSFAPNQVWAAYDDDDGMPRYYALIHSVISSKPLKMQISWLNSKNNRELSPINWIGSGFFKTSGVFWIGKHEKNNSLNSFSHKVKWAKSTRGTIQIYPRKGDVWAMYTNWSPDWNALTPDDVIHKYKMVEVLEDFKEDRGVSIVPLVKVAGFKTVFHRHPNSSTIKTISKEELFCLSHQVPSYVLSSKDGQNVPIGCLELDPASMPLELLQVFTEAQVREMIENAEKPLENEKQPEVKEKTFIVYKRRGRPN